MELGGLTGAAHGDRSPGRLVRHDGYRVRERRTLAAAVELRIPRLRRGSRFPPFLEPRRLAGQVPTAVIQAAQAHGTPTRSVDDLMRATGTEGVPEGQVLRLCAETDDRVCDVLVRLVGGDRPDLRLDATDVAVREAGRIASAWTEPPTPDRTRRIPGCPGAAWPTSSAPSCPSARR